MAFTKKGISLYFIVIMLVLTGSIRIAYCMSRPGNSLNLILITIDTLRSDHLGCYGHDAIKTPNIDGLAHNGTLFTNAYSPSPLTFPSHVSLMTGQYPIRHGVQNNCSFVLNDSAETLAEMMKKKGYATGAIVASFVLASHFGLSQGFDLYDDYFLHQNIEKPDYSEDQRIADTVTDLANAWIQKSRNKPFFLWVHYFDPHSPYTPPSPFDESYKHNPYDGEIAYTDQCIGLFWEELKKLSLLDNTCIVLVGDHGEGLWEHNEQTHGLFIYDTTLRVPLIISYPKLFPKGNRVPSLVRTVDIMPTMLELLGIGSKKTSIQGTSLIPLITDTEKDMPLDLYCESRYPELNFGWAPLEGIVTREGWKYIHAPKPELYNLKNDPGEKINLLAAEPQRVQSLLDRLLSLKKDLSAGSRAHEVSKPIAISPETRERLRSLGYIGVPGSLEDVSGDQNDQELPDPKDKAHLLAKLDEARDFEEKGEFDQVIRNYEEVLKEDPDNKTALFYAAQFYKKTGNPEKALGSLQKLAELDPENYDAKNSLGLVYDILGMPENAIQVYMEAIQINPKIPYLHHNLAYAYLKMNDLDRAIHEFEQMQASSQDPVVISIAVGNIGGIYLREKNFEKALKKFKESIRFNPMNRDAHVSLADAYYNLGDIEHTIDEWKTVIDLRPDDYMAYYKLAQLFVEARNPDQAIFYLKKCLQFHPDFIDARILLQQIYQGSSLDQM